MGNQGCERLEHVMSVLFVEMGLGKDDSVRCIQGLACTASCACTGECPWTLGQIPALQGQSHTAQQGKCHGFGSGNTWHFL